MTAATLADPCRCGHARRDHIGVDLPEKAGASCYHQTETGKYDCQCHYFERDVSAVVLFRDQRGRLHTHPTEIERGAS